MSSYVTDTQGLVKILKTASQIDDIPELHDRLIAATAKHLDLPLITNDPVISKSKFVMVLKPAQK